MRLLVLSILAVILHVQVGPFPTAVSVPVNLGLLVATLVTAWSALRRRRRRAALALPVLLAATAGSIMGPVDMSVSSSAELGVRVVPVYYGLMVFEGAERADASSSDNRGCLVPLYPKKWTIQIGLAPVDLQHSQVMRLVDQPTRPPLSRRAERIAAASWAAVLVDAGTADEALLNAWNDLTRRISRLDGEKGLSRWDLYRAAPNQWGGNDQAMDEVLAQVLRLSPAFDRLRAAFPGIESTSIVWLTADDDQSRWGSQAFGDFGANATAIPANLGLAYWLDSEPVDLLIVNGGIDAESLEKLSARMEAGNLPPAIVYMPSESAQLLAEAPGIGQAESPEELLVIVLEIAQRLWLLEYAESGIQPMTAPMIRTAIANAETSL